MSKEVEYTPVVITAGEDQEVEVILRDELTVESGHVTTPESDESKSVAG